MQHSRLINNTPAPLRTNFTLCIKFPKLDLEVLITVSLHYCSPSVDVKRASVFTNQPVARISLSLVNSPQTGLMAVYCLPLCGPKAWDGVCSERERKVQDYMLLFHSWARCCGSLRLNLINTCLYWSHRHSCLPLFIYLFTYFVRHSPLQPHSVDMLSFFMKRKDRPACCLVVWNWSVDLKPVFIYHWYLLITVTLVLLYWKFKL